MSSITKFKGSELGSSGNFLSKPTMVYTYTLHAATRARTNKAA